MISLTPEKPARDCRRHNRGADPAPHSGSVINASSEFGVFGGLEIQRVKCGLAPEDGGLQNLLYPSRPHPKVAVDAAHAEIFDLEGFFDAVFRAFAADAAILHTVEGGDLGRDYALVEQTMPYSSPSARRQMRPVSQP